MGKVPKLLHILVPAEMLEWPEIIKLREQGHIIEEWHGGAVFNLGPHCWRMNETLRKHLPLAIKGMRELAYPKPVDEPEPSL